MEPVTQVMELAEPKKYSIRYNAKKDEIPEAPFLAIYVNKLTLGKNPPATLKVTVEEA